MSYFEIELTAVNWRNEPAPSDGPQLRVVGEDELEQPVEEEVTPSQPETYPVTINVYDIREYYPRRRGRVGTRVVFKNGAARPVTEAYADVRAKIAAARANGHVS